MLDLPEYINAARRLTTKIRTVTRLDTKIAAKYMIPEERPLE